MALSSEDIRRIHSRSLATPGRKYYGDNERVYIGTREGRLKLLDKALEVTYKTDTLQPLRKDVQHALDNLSNRVYGSIKEIEIDFGSELYQNQKVFVIDDTEVKSTSIVTASLAYKASSLKDLDETEMDEILFKCSANNGSINILATSLYGSVYGPYIINYQINY